MTEKHFRINLEEAEEPSGITTCAVRSCIACKTMISGNGGGGDWICADCWHVLYSGRLSYEFRHIKYVEESEHE